MPADIPPAGIPSQNGYLPVWLVVLAFFLGLAADLLGVPASFQALFGTPDGADAPGGPSLQPSWLAAGVVSIAVALLTGLGHVLVSRASPRVHLVGVVLVALSAAVLLNLSVGAFVEVPAYPVASFAAGGVVSSWLVFFATGGLLDAGGDASFSQTATTLRVQAALCGVVTALAAVDVAGLAAGWPEALFALVGSLLPALIWRGGS